MESSELEDQAHVVEIMNQLVAERKSKFSQQKVAEIMNTYQGGISAIELMKFDVRLSHLMKYARAIGCKIRLSIEDAS